jgi:hypothetical protein
MLTSGQARARCVPDLVINLRYAPWRDWGVLTGYVRHQATSFDHARSTSVTLTRCTPSVASRPRLVSRRFPSQSLFAMTTRVVTDFAAYRARLRGIPLTLQLSVTGSPGHGDAQAQLLEFCHQLRLPLLFQGHNLAIDFVELSDEMFALILQLSEFRLSH